MRGLGHDRMLAGTALALPVMVVLAMSPAAMAQPDKLEAAVPMPAQTTLAPPTAADVTATIPDTAAPAAPEAAPEAPATIAAEPAPVDPLASLDPADRPIAEKMRDLLTAKVDKIFGNKKERSTVEAFYTKRSLAPLWLDKGVVNARAKAAIERLKRADADGLDAKDYKLPNFDAGQTPEALAEAELKFTATVLTFARHLQAGRFPFYRISGKDIDVPQQPPEQADVLAKLADTANVASALDEYEPPHAAYKKLKAKLAELRGTTSEEEKVVRIPEGPLLRPGMEDARVPLLRQRLKVDGDPDSKTYDKDLVDAVKAYQKAKGGNADGLVGNATIRQLNGQTPPRRTDSIETIIVNMERWRWYPRDMGKAHVVVNIPEFMLRVYKDNALHWSTRVVVGLPNKQTPLLAAQMKYITVNPTWNVPPSIINNEYLPALAQDPTVLDRMGLKVTHNRDGSVHIYQPPGDGNALGRVRFNFPNKFLVYQHDTPDKHLFARDERAYSHGCMRVQDPPKYAEVLLNLVRPQEGWTAEKIRSMYGRAEQDIQFPTFIPVNLTYQTAYVDDDGKLQIRRDIYGIDQRMQAAIRNERGMVEMAQDRPKDSGGSGGGGVVRAKLPQQQRQVGFFEALFGGGGGYQQQQQPQMRRPPARVR